MSSPCNVFTIKRFSGDNRLEKQGPKEHALEFFGDVVSGVQNEKPLQIFCRMYKNSRILVTTVISTQRDISSYFSLSVCVLGYIPEGPRTILD